MLGDHLTASIIIHDRMPELACPENRAVLDYWLALRGDADMPPRDRFNPMRIGRHLPNVIMLEPQGPESAIVRTFGTELCRRLGVDLTGADLVQLYQGERRQGLRELIEGLTRARVISVAHSEWTTPSGHHFITENLWLPFAGADGSVTRMLGAIHEPQCAGVSLDALGGALDTAQQNLDRLFFRVPHTARACTAAD